MTTAPPLVLGSPRGAWAACPIATQALLAVTAMAAVFEAAPVFGLALPVGVATMLAIGAVALAAWPRRAREIGMLVCVALLVSLRPGYAAYHLALVAILHGCRRRTWTLMAALGLGGAALCLLKAGALLALRRTFPRGGYAAWPADALAALPIGRLWGVVALNYLQLVLLLSGLAEAGILVARLYGWPSPFRFALLAWNPVELWRRWGIYTRRFLLKTVYFPLGGSERHRFRNVMLTFLASALVLHSGWLGSPYWVVGAGGWRDHALYFGVQGLAVCGCLALWHPGADRVLRWSWARVPATLTTQAFSAWAHIIILAQAVPLSGRFRLMARCLGF